MSRDLEENQIKELIQNCDRLIKAGQPTAVASLIAELNLSQVPRRFIQNLAKICRRAGLIQQGLRLLHPLIRSKTRMQNQATPGELCEYSVLLSRNGSIHEALRLLEGVNADLTPEAFLYKAYCHISNWDYALAIPLLQKFLSASVDDYSKLIARVNLASSYVATEQLEAALSLLEETLPLARSQSSQRLSTNCLELIGHVYFFKNDFTQSRKYLNEALANLGGGTSDDHLMIQKTESFISAFEQNSLAPLHQFRKQATEMGRWEWVRETDLYAAKVSFNQQQFDHLIFGSPLKAFRERVHKELKATVSATYVLGEAHSKIFDLQTGRLNGSDLNAGKKIHQTLAVLLKDFYAPQSLGSLFEDLYPGEYFDVNTSGKRVGQLLLRTRHWLVENEIPVSIVEKDGGYRLVVKESFGICISLAGEEIKNESIKWQQLTACFQKKSFSPKEACAKLNWPRSTFLRVVHWALQEGKVERLGAGRHVSYQVLSLQTNLRSNAA